MVNNHLCVESCFAARTADKYIIACFFCEKKFNSRCFDLTSLHKLLSSATNAFFMCYKCIDRTNKLKHNVRRSNEPSATVASQKMSDATSSSNTNNNGSDKGTISQVLALLSIMDEKISRINNTNGEIMQRSPRSNLLESDHVTTELLAINQNVIGLHAKVDHGLKMQSESETRNKSMMEKLDDLQLNIHKSPAIEKPTTATLGFSTSKKGPNKTLSSLDPFNWSFSFNQSIMPNDTSDLYQLLHGFEQNTWTSFDFLFKKWNETSDSILKIETLCKQFNITDQSPQLRSPVTESIVLDNLHGINEKCDKIEKNLISLDSHVKELRIDSDINDQATQVLRNRYLNLIDEETDIKDQPNDVNAITNQISYTHDLLHQRPTSDLHTTEPMTNSDNNATNDNQPPQRMVSDRLSLSFYVTKFAPNTTTEMITEYLQDNGIADIASTRISCLIPRGKDRSLINFVSFKIDTNEATAKVITSPGFWPKQCFINEFVQRSVVDLTQNIATRKTLFFQNPPHTINQR